MSAKILEKEDIKFGQEILAIAICAKVEKRVNFSTTGGFREIYQLSGKDGALVNGVLFKNNFSNSVNLDEWLNVPVLVKGTVGEYRDTLQLSITSISNLKDSLDMDDLKRELFDTTILSDINDILYDNNCTKILAEDHLMPAIGIEDGGCGVLVERLLKVLKVTEVLFPELLSEYISIIHPIVHLYRYTENKLADRLSSANLDKGLLRALLFNPQEYPQYLDFVKLHHIIVKPRGCNLEISDNGFDTTSRCLRGFDS